MTEYSIVYSREIYKKLPPSEHHISSVPLCIQITSTPNTIMQLFAKYSKPTQNVTEKAIDQIIIMSYVMQFFSFHYFFSSSFS